MSHLLMYEMNVTDILNELMSVFILFYYYF